MPGARQTVSLTASWVNRVHVKLDEGRERVRGGGPARAEGRSRKQTPCARGVAAAQCGGDRVTGSVTEGLEG